MASPTSLRDLQTAALRQMLSLNQAPPAASASSASALASTRPAPTWSVTTSARALAHAARRKVLILDARAQDVIATTLRVQDLRDCGVTLHMQLHADNRPPLPDVPAVYFVAPTLENVRRIADDLAKGLYDSTHLNFTSAVPRPLLEELASLIAQNGTVELVEQVCCCGRRARG